MPVLDPDELFEEAARSILEQAYQDLELMIVQEAGAREGLDRMIEELGDQRVVLIKNTERLGLAGSLNVGFGAARGSYLARMDADDVSSPDRIEKQVRYLDEHLNIGILGTWLKFEGDAPIHYSNDKLPSNPQLTRWMLHFHNALAHPTVMMRREVWERLGGYLPEAEPCEDYDLWLRAMRFADLMSLPEPLVTYRVRGSSISGTRREEQKRKASELVGRAFEISLGKPVDRGIVQAVLNPYQISSPRQGVQAAHFIYMIYNSFLWWERMTPWTQACLRRDISVRLSDILARSLRLGPLYSPMVLWQASRFGPATFVRLLADTGRKGIMAIP